jgi:hypothetical protein
MRSEWEALHTGLVRTIGTKQAKRLFDGLRRRGTAISKFDAPRELVEYLAHPGGDLDEKDLVLTELATVTTAGPTASLAMALLLLGLWPGLDAVFGRRARFCHDQTGELAAEMVASFTDHVRRLNPERVRRVAATLVRSTERDVLRASIRDLRRRRHVSGVPIEVAENIVAAASGVDESPSRSKAASSLCPKASNDSLDEQIAVLRSWLADLIGREADLVIDAILLRRTRLELGAERGIGKWAARKRLQRALLRVRKRLEGQIPASREGEGWRLPEHEHETRVPGLSGLG